MNGLLAKSTQQSAPSVSLLFGIDLASEARARLVERFWAKVDKNGPLWNGTQCWLWLGFTSDRHGHPNGYGSMSYRFTRMPAHRFSWELRNGRIPSGLTLDHLCRNKTCVNPEHLEAVSLPINILRSDTVTAMNKRKTHCPKGHPYDLLNTYFCPNKRRCRICDYERNKSIARVHTTEWQKRILKFLESAPNCMASTWEIAINVFPETWLRHSSRGALIGHIDRAGQKMGLVRLPPQGEYGAAILCLTDAMRGQQAKEQAK